MKEVSKARLAREIGKSGAIITRLINAGILDSCFTPDGKKLYLEKAIKAIINSKGSDYIGSDIAIDISTNEKVKENEQIYTKEAKDELQIFLDAEPSPAKQIDMIDKFWSGRIRRQKFMQEEGELISVHDAKIAVDTLLSPLNKYLDDQANNIKNHFPDLSNEIVNFISSENNRQKEELKAKNWED